MKRDVRAIEWLGDELRLLDQRKLPEREVWIRARTAETVARAIETLAVRGAPVIGIAAGYGVALAARRTPDDRKAIRKAIERLRGTRPTGRNLFAVLDAMDALVRQDGADWAERIERAAVRFHREDEQACLAMARHGAELLNRSERVLTYCNTGALATGGIGTALGVIKLGFRKKKIREVFACETRPVLQGARLTVWECARAGIPVTLICDNMAAALMRSRQITRVLVGADRIAHNGDVSNKIGTLSLAILAGERRIPFHVVAPLSTFDPSLASGGEMQIEERRAEEITGCVPGFRRLKGVQVWNPAFDVTPGRLVTSFVTDAGVLHPPFRF